MPPIKTPSLVIGKPPGPDDHVELLAHTRPEGGVLAGKLDIVLGRPAEAAAAIAALPFAVSKVMKLQLSPREEDQVAELVAHRDADRLAEFARLGVGRGRGAAGEGQVHGARGDLGARAIEFHIFPDEHHISCLACSLTDNYWSLGFFYV